jgi:hypothetical protein
MTRLHLLLYAPVVLAFVLGLAACGASGSPSGTTTNAASGNRAQFALARCMRTHGVPNFPDPRPVTGGFSISATPGSSTLTVDGTTFAGPAFVSAEKTCKLFGGGTSPPPITASQKRAAVAFAECMRKHGVPNYPDPTFPAGGGIAQGPGINRNSPAVQAAAAVCGKAGS